MDYSNKDWFPIDPNHADQNAMHRVINFNLTRVRPDTLSMLMYYYMHSTISLCS